jgi:hypothetical protein
MTSGGAMFRALGFVSWLGGLPAGLAPVDTDAGPHDTGLTGSTDGPLAEWQTQGT